jgi:hypothetical protein
MVTKLRSKDELPGGMQETTLNSTITELAPAIAFMKNFNIRGSSLSEKISNFYSQLQNVDHNSLMNKVYLDPRDKQAGIEFIESFPNSSKFFKKMENAIAIFEELQNQNKINPIEKVYWGYRLKPDGVAKNHKGDLFVVLKEPKKSKEVDRMLGVSLKAGEAKSKEPGFNTYVNKLLLELLGTAKGEAETKKLRKKLYDDIYYRFAPAAKPQDKMEEKYDLGQSRQITKKNLLVFERKNRILYEQYYDYMLETCRQVVVNNLNADLEKTKNYIKKNIAKPVDIPGLIVLKAIDSRTEIKTDMDSVSIFLPRTVEIKSYSSPTSKQDFFIDMITKNEDTLSLKFAIRSNKGTLDHKLQQFFNLAIKFNGLA